MSEIGVIKVGDLDIKKIEVDGNDYLCISDFVAKDGLGSGVTIIKWLSNKETGKFLGLWENLNNPNFNVTEFGNIRLRLGDNNYSLSPKQWINKTNAIGITSKAGRYNSGTYAHIDIAMEFVTWLSPEFKLYLITEFQRLKKQEAEKKNELQDWNIFRDFTKMGYKIQTDAIQQNVIPVLNISKDKEYIVYSSEADLLNIAVFGMKAQEFAKLHPEVTKKGQNIRDTASKKALLIIDHLQSANSTMMRDGITDRNKRFERLIIQATEEKKSLGIKMERDLYKYDLSVQQLLPNKKQIEDTGTVDNIKTAEITKNIPQNLEIKKGIDFEASLKKVATRETN